MGFDLWELTDEREEEVDRILGGKGQWYSIFYARGTLYISLDNQYTLEQLEELTRYLRGQLPERKVI